MFKQLEFCIRKLFTSHKFSEQQDIEENFATVRALLQVKRFSDALELLHEVKQQLKSLNLLDSHDVILAANTALEDLARVCNSYDSGSTYTYDSE